MQETQVWSLGQGDSLDGKWQPAPVFLLAKSHGQRSLVGYSPWGCKSWTQLHEHAHINTDKWIDVAIETHVYP